MKIVITGPDTYECLSIEAPEPGMVYQLEPATDGSAAQNRLFHPLVMEYYKSGLWSYPGSGYRLGLTYHEFRDTIKRDLGAGFESFVYASPEGIVKVKTREEIPPQYNNSKYALGRLKSWADYAMRERRMTIDALIAEMLQMGVDSKKFHEIMDGISKLQRAS